MVSYLRRLIHRLSQGLFAYDVDIELAKHAVMSAQMFGSIENPKGAQQQ